MVWVSVRPKTNGIVRLVPIVADNFASLAAGDDRFKTVVNGSSFCRVRGL